MFFSDLTKLNFYHILIILPNLIIYNLLHRFYLIHYFFFCKVVLHINPFRTFTLTFNIVDIFSFWSIWRLIRRVFIWIWCCHLFLAFRELIVYVIKHFLYNIKFRFVYFSSIIFNSRWVFGLIFIFIYD